MRQALRALFGLALVAWPFATRAKDACPVSLVPETASPAWKAARVEAEKRLAKTHGDCRLVQIEVHEGGHATLLFTTTDGRSASRELASPSELPSMLEALLVTLPLEVPSASVAASSPPPSPSPAPSPTGSPSVVASSTPSVSPTASASAVPVVAPTPPERRVFHVQPMIGARFGLDEDIVAPSILLQGMVVFGALELGLRGEWNPLHGSLGRTPPAGFTMYSGYGDLVAGTRLRFGALEVPLGIAAGIGGTYESAESEHVRTLQTRAGAYSGLAYALDPAVRFTLGVGFDVVLSGLRDKGTELKQIWPLPREGLLIGLGVEVAP